MRSRFSSPTSDGRPRSARRARRGYTLAEAVVAGGVGALVIASVVGLLSTAARMEATTLLQGDTDREAVAAMQRLSLEVREAKEVVAPGPHRCRIFFPVVTAGGRYDRTRRDDAHWVEYAQTDAEGRPHPSGEYLWRSTESDAGRRVAENVRQFRVQVNSDRAVQVSLRIERSERHGRGRTWLDQRVLYLRNR